MVAKTRKSGKTFCRKRQNYASNPTQQITTIGTTCAALETVTIIDPRHPLFGMTLPLVGFYTRTLQGHCCVLALRPHIEVVVPLAATDRAPDPITPFPLPLCLSAVRQLLATFARLVDTPVEEPSHARATHPSTAAATAADPAARTTVGLHFADPGLDTPDHAPTTSATPDPADHLPPPAPGQPTPGGAS
jgi:hypothetical protein